MGRLSNIVEKIDAKYFREDYKDLRSKSLYLISDNQICNDLIYILPYEKIESLIQYIENRDYAHRGPLRGMDLRLNGFSEILDEFEMPIKRYPFEFCLTFKDDEIINAQKLINKLVQLESYTALLPHLNDRKYNLYILRDQFGKIRSDVINKYNKEAEIYSEFIMLANGLKHNPYIDLDISDNNPHAYLPTVLITFANRPYICFEQSNIGTLYSHNRGIPKYKITENMEFKYYNGGTVPNKTFTDVSSIFDELFSEPENSNRTKNRIIEVFESLFDKKIDETDICYDWVKGCYCLSPEMEDCIFSKYTITLSKSSYFCKYTTLSTLMNILNSGEMRLNSIVTMNDPTETQKLFSEGCNFVCDGENPDDSKKFVNNYYLTSFTCSQNDSYEEDLDMWRYYGDDACGVCLVFEPLIDNHQVFEVNYDDLNTEELVKIEIFLSSLKEEGIRFCIESYVEKYLFIKPKDYQTEKESRIIIGTIEKPEFTVYSNNIVTPYIHRKLTYNSNEVTPSCKKTFPLKLTRVILGPEMKNKEINKLNIESMIQSKSLFNEQVAVDVSKIKCYRK